MLSNSLLKMAVFIAASGIFTVGYGKGLRPISDEAMSQIAGADGISMAVDLNTKIGSVVFGVYDTQDNVAFLRYKDYTETGTYLARMNVLSRPDGQSDFIDFLNPNILTTKPLQIGYDIEVEANGKIFGAGIAMQDVVIAGSSMQWTTGATGGLAFGAGMYETIERVTISPEKRNPGNTEGQMTMDKVSITGTTANTPWVVADLDNQPGYFRAVQDSNGVTNLQFGIDWPKGTAEAATGQMTIDRVAFTAIPGGNPVELGRSSIGSMQIQYMNIKVRSP